MPPNDAKTADTEKKSSWFTPQTPGRWYEEYVGKVPAIEAGALGTLGAAGGFYGGGWLTRKILSGMMAGKSEEERDALLRELEQDGTLENIQLALGGLGGAAGVAYVLNKKLHTGGGIGMGLKSIFTPDFYKKNPELAQARTRTYLQRMLNRPYRLQQQYYTSGRQKTAALSKTAVMDAYADAFVQSTVPVSYSMDLITRDPILSPPAKGATNLLLETASGGSGSGMVSGKDLARSAVQAGVGFGTAYLFGRALGGLLSLPPDVTKRLSNIGGIGGAIINTGVLRELL